MTRAARLQLIGPAVLFSAVLAAESAAYLLTQAPSSAFLWYLNLEVFSLFRKSRGALADYCSLPFAQVWIMAGPMALIGLLGLAFKRNICLAISSNLSFVFAAFAAYSWYEWNSLGKVKAASLVWVGAPTGGSLYLFLILLTASFFSFAASHLLYFRELKPGR
jgi:hypothetical protein